MPEKEKQIAFRRSDIREHKFEQVKKLSAFKHIKKESQVFDKLCDIALSKPELFEDDLVNKNDLFSLVRSLKEQQLETDTTLIEIIKNMNERLERIETKLDKQSDEGQDFFDDEEPVINQHSKNKGNKREK